MPGYLQLRYPGILGRRKWKPKEEMGGNGRAREGERESVEKCCFCFTGLRHLSRLSKKSNIQIILNEVRVRGSRQLKVPCILHIFLRYHVIFKDPGEEVDRKCC